MYLFVYFKMVVYFVSLWKLCGCFWKESDVKELFIIMKEEIIVCNFDYVKIVKEKRVVYDDIRVKF